MLCKVIILAGLSIVDPVKPKVEEPVDTIAIEEVIVNSKLQRFSSSLSLKIIPTSDLKQGKQLLLTDMISSISSIAVNNYGPGGIALASLRGLGTYHTAVLWNGINLQNSMNGNANLQSIPVNFVDQVAIQYGGNGALFGSGAIGGTIHIDNSIDFGKGHSSEFYQTYGSFSSIFSGLNYIYSGISFGASTKLFYSQADNDFRFHNIAKIGKPYENQENSNSSKFGVLQNLAYKISQGDIISTTVWFQNSFNRYPPMMSSTSNREYEHTQFIRGIGQWKATRKQIDFNIRSGLIDDSQIYRNPVTGEASDHFSLLGLVEGETIYKVSQNQKIEAGINLSAESINSTNYAQVERRYRQALSAAYSYCGTEGKLEAFAGLREEFVNNASTPMTWSVGTRVKLFENIGLKANVSKNYRIPSMNDLYWTGWGNPNLKPESGYGEEIGVDYVSRTETFSLITKINAFNNIVNNWIIWLPNGSVWSPYNMKEVWARGVDLSANFSRSTKKWSWGFDLAGTGTISTTEKSGSQTEIGKQLAFIPKVKASGTVYATYEGFGLKYSHAYTGKRYTTATNTSHLDPFMVSGLSIEKNFEGQVFSIKSFIRVDNIWNQEYQGMPFYPMPLRNYQIGVSILFNKPISKS